MIVDIQTRAPRAYTVVAERMEYHALELGDHIGSEFPGAVGNW